MTSEVRQVIVMRKDLPMTAGKMVAQGAHASMKVILDLCRVIEEPGGPYTMVEGRICIPQRRGLVLTMTEHLEAWLLGSFAKICVRVESEAGLLAVFQKAKDAGLPCAMIVDEGRTAFHGVPTKTCCAIGPAPKDLLDPITGGLKLL